MCSVKILATAFTRTCPRLMLPLDIAYSNLATSQLYVHGYFSDIIQPTDNESTPKKVIVDMATRTRKATRKYIARKRNGHYTSPTASVKTGVSTLHEGIYNILYILIFY